MFPVHESSAVRNVLLFLRVCRLLVVGLTYGAVYAGVVYSLSYDKAVFRSAPTFSLLSLVFPRIQFTFVCAVRFMFITPIAAQVIVVHAASTQYPQPEPSAHRVLVFRGSY